MYTSENDSKGVLGCAVGLAAATPECPSTGGVVREYLTTLATSAHWVYFPALKRSFRARAYAVALDFCAGIQGTEVGFFELTLFMAPIGWLMVLVLWGFFMIVCKPEKKEIPGLRDHARELHKGLGPMSGGEWTRGWM